MKRQRKLKKKKIKYRIAKTNSQTSALETVCGSPGYVGKVYNT